MTSTYALYFVPRKLEREKLALLRRKLCKRFENRKAVMYPVHLTLVREFSLENYKGFTEELSEYCSGKKPIKLKAAKNLTSREKWGGVEVQNTNILASFQKHLVEISAAHGEVEHAEFDPHISLVYARRLPSLRTQSSPVKAISLDRVSLVMQTSPGTPFRVVKHFALG